MDGQLETVFMGLQLPPSVGHRTYPTTVEFLRSLPDGREESLGVIPKPYNDMPTADWLKAAKRILDQHDIPWTTSGLSGSSVG